MKTNCFRRVLVLCLIIGNAGIAKAQDAVWTLEKCMAYARAHNLNIQQGVLNERVAKMRWEQSRLSVLPNVVVSSGYGRNFGRSIDPTTNTFNSTTYDFTGISGSAGVLLFGWFRTRNTIARDDLLHKVSGADQSQLEDDITLHIATAYLRILLAKEQVAISLNHLKVTNGQVRQTQKLLAAGRSNGLDLTQVKTQLVADSTDYFKAELACQQAAIDMKALLNLELSSAFDVQAVDSNNGNAIWPDPEAVYNDALAKSNMLRSADLKIQSARKDLAVARGNLYPQLNVSLSSGTNYASTYTELLPGNETRTMPLGKQFQNNFSQSVYLGLSIPLFNGLSSRYAIRQAKASVENYKLQAEETKLKLKQDIYKACNEAKTAWQTCRAAQSAATLAQTGADFAQKRYEKGLIPAIELLLAQNTAFKANADEASAKYDLMFKMIVIDYYRGEGLFR